MENMMIRLTRLNHPPLVLNCDLIERIDVTPATVITLTTGPTLRVRETASEVIRRVVDFSRKLSAREPDLAIRTGLAVALAGILGGLLLEKGSIQDVSQITAALIVLGGTVGAVLVTTPLSIFRRAVKALRGVFFERAGATEESIE